jgi:hypothetical protein
MTCLQGVDMCQWAGWALVTLLLPCVGVLPKPARRPRVMACCSGQRYAVGCPTCSLAVV